MKKKEKSVLLSIENNLFYISNILYLKFLDYIHVLKIVIPVLEINENNSTRLSRQ